MEKLCKNCKHWSIDGLDSWEDKRFGYCNKIHNDISGTITSATDVDDNEVVTEDFESYASIMRTGQNFGCIHFKEKEND